MKTKKKRDNIFLNAAKLQFKEGGFTCFVLLGDPLGASDPYFIDWYRRLYNNFKDSNGTINNILSTIARDYCTKYSIRSNWCSQYVTDATNDHVKECRIMCLLLADIIYNEENKCA